MDNRKYVQAQPFTLAGSGVSPGNPTVTLSSFVGIDGALLTMADFGTKGLGTCEPGSAGQEEQWSFTGVTQNANGSATLTGISSVGFTYPYAETTNVQKSHAGGVQFVISNTSAFYDGFTNKNDDELIAGDWTFTDSPAVGNVTSSDLTKAANVAFVNATAVAGAPNASTTVKGIVEIATGAELAAGTNTGSTGAVVVASGGSFKSASAGAADANKAPVTAADGTIDQSFLDSARTIGAVYSAIANNIQITTDPDSPNDPVRNSFFQSQLAALTSFGDGSDGAFAQTSGTVTLDDPAKYVYQYSSFSLTGTAALALGANNQARTVHIFVQGNLTVTSSATPAVSANGRGGLGAGAGTGTTGVNGASGAFAPGNPNGNAGLGGVTATSAGNQGSGGGGGGGVGFSGAPGISGGGTAAAAGVAGIGLFNNANAPLIYLMEGLMGGGGGSGSAGISGGGVATGTGGTGGNGGGNIVFVVGGSVNITGQFSSTGSAGGTGTAGSQQTGGGGGGGAGSIGILYAGTLTANTATSVFTGGAAGASSGGIGTGGAGGAGALVVRKINVRTLVNV